MLPLPPELVHWEKAEHLTASQNRLDALIENMCLVHNGMCKVLVQQWRPLEELRSVKGFEHARMPDPYAAGIGNSIRYLTMAPHEDILQVKGVANLFCGGEKAGQLVGHTEAAVTWVGGA